MQIVGRLERGVLPESLSLEIWPLPTWLSIALRAATSDTVALTASQQHLPGPCAFHLKTELENHASPSSERYVPAFAAQILAWVHHSTTFSTACS